MSNYLNLGKGTKIIKDDTNTVQIDFYLVETKDCEILNDWQVSGLKNTENRSVRLDKSSFHVNVYQKPIKLKIWI